MIRKLIEEIIEAHGKSGIRVFNQMRISLTVIGLSFVFGGLGGLMGFFEFRTNGKVDEGADRYVSIAFFLITGIISLILRLTFFKNKRDVQ